MADAFLGEIRVFAGGFAPAGWAPCDGRLMSIPQNAALFSLLGTNYGGNGTTTFALPDLRGAVPIGAGAGPGRTPRDVGDHGGAATVTLAQAQLPPHAHAAAASGAVGSADAPTGNVWAVPGGSRGERMYGTDTQAAMNAGALAPVGGNQPHNNLQPYLQLSFIICLNGLYPPRG